MSASLLITARSTQPKKHQSPASREPRTGIEIKFWRRFIYTAVYEAMICRAGQPTGNAILQKYWIESKVDTNHHLYPMSWDDACRNAGRDPDDARTRALRKITKAWMKAAKQAWAMQYRQNVDAVLSCAGVDVPGCNQAVLALVEIADYEGVAMLDDPEPLLPFLATA